MTVEPSVAPYLPRLAPSPQPGDGGIAMPAALDWVTRLPSAAAPGFVYLAGAAAGLRSAAAAPISPRPRRAWAGETAEVLAQTADPVPSAFPAIRPSTRPGHSILRRSASPQPTPSAAGGSACRPRQSFFAARRSPSAGPMLPPRASGSPPDRIPTAARLAGLLELIERDAAAGWWCEGVRPRQADAADIAAAAAELAGFRAGAAAARPTGFLVLEAAARVPVVCAMSSDADGRGLAFGLKAAPEVAGCRFRRAGRADADGACARDGAPPRRAGRPVGRGPGPLARAALAPEAFAALAAWPAAIPAEAPGDFTALAAALAARATSWLRPISPRPLPGLRSPRSSCRVFGRFPAGCARPCRVPPAPSRR